MKKEIATLNFNLDHIQDRQDSARGHMDRFRHENLFPQMCEEFKALLWPEVRARRGVER